MELRIAQAEYDKQMEITKLLMEGLNAIQVHWSQCQDRKFVRQSYNDKN